MSCITLYIYDHGDDFFVTSENPMEDDNKELIYLTDGDEIISDDEVSDENYNDKTNDKTDDKTNDKPVEELYQDYHTLNLAGPKCKNYIVYIILEYDPDDDEILDLEVFEQDGVRYSIITCEEFKTLKVANSYLNQIHYKFNGQGPYDVHEKVEMTYKKVKDLDISEIPPEGFFIHGFILSKEKLVRYSLVSVRHFFGDHKL